MVQIVERSKTSYGNNARDILECAIILSVAPIPRPCVVHRFSQARHLMLLTKGNAALSLLFDMKLLDHADTEVLFGSDFPGDRTDMQARQDSKP